VPILFFGAFVPVAPAQCSQAALLDAAPSDVATSDTSDAMRFGTGNAVTVLENTPLQLRNEMPISSRSTREGAKVSFTVTRDVVVDGILVIPCGATVYGTVVSSKQAGRLVGASNLTLELTTLNLDGKSYPLYTVPFKVRGQSKTRPTMTKISTGAAVGAAAMDSHIVTADSHPQGEVRARSDAIAAGMGAGVGTAVAASSPPSIAMIPAEAEMEFTLASPIAVYPVDQRTAARLADGMHHGPPALYVRGESQ
jgi:hypothetical protein